MAFAWFLFGSTVTAHETPAWSLPKKITCTFSALVIFVLLIVARRKGGIGCALLFFLCGAFIVGAVGCHVHTLRNDGTISTPELGPLHQINDSFTTTPCAFSVFTCTNFASSASCTLSLWHTAFLPLWASFMISS